MWNKTQELFDFNNKCVSIYILESHNVFNELYLSYSMKIVDVNEEREERERRMKDRYDKAISLADRVFGKERVSGEGRDIAGGRYDSFYVDFINESGPLKCGVEIDLVGRPEIKVYGEKNFLEAKRFGEEFERMFEEEVTLRHNFPQGSQDYKD